MITTGFFALLSTVLFFTSYMENDTSFPKPPTPTEERELVLKVAGGCRESRDILIKHNMRLVVHIAKKYTNYPDIEELISVGAMGLIKGIDNFKPEKSPTLAAFCARCIENEMLMAMRSSKKFKNDVSLYDPIGTDKDGNELVRVDILPDSRKNVIDEVEERLNNDRLREIMAQTLPEKHLKIMHLRYGLNGDKPMTQKEVAKLFGISRSYISRIEKKCLEELRVKVEADRLR